MNPILGEKEKCSYCPSPVRQNSGSKTKRVAAVPARPSHMTAHDFNMEKSPERTTCFL